MLAAAAALSIQALLIIGLLFERRARRRAEMESRRNLGLASDVSRRETMSALTSSIAHELAQPLSAMILQRGSAAIDDQYECARRRTNIEEILSDIHAGASSPRKSSSDIGRCFGAVRWQKKPVNLQTSRG